MSDTAHEEATGRQNTNSRDDGMGRGASGSIAVAVDVTVLKYKPELRQVAGVSQVHRVITNAAHANQSTKDLNHTRTFMRSDVQVIT